LLRDIYRKSTRNLITALDFRKSAIQTVRIYDNSARFRPDNFHFRIPEIMTIRQGQVRQVGEPTPSWLGAALKNTKYDVARARDQIGASREPHDPGRER
jgi:hypothetical protein